MGRDSGDNSDPEEARIFLDKKEEVLLGSGKRRITLKARVTEGR